MKKNFIAIDLGATSGRVILARIDGASLRMEELHRFPNTLTRIGGRCYWNLYALYDQIVEGLCAAGRRGIEVCSIGVDTWGVDYVCVAEDGSLLGLPRAYRDPYTAGAPERFFRTMPREKVYDRTGIQIMEINTLFQLYAAGGEACSALKAAETLLFIPDAISYLLTGEKVCEYTILSTSQLLDPRTGEIDAELLEKVGVRGELFARQVMPGERIGLLDGELSARTGLGRVPVVAVAGHDTASAVAAVPAEDERFAYLSSGTWSLMGIVSARPIITEDSFRLNFTNEGGLDGTTRFLKNITGMWLIEQCRAEWRRCGREYTYDELEELTSGARPFGSLIDPDDPAFVNPASMPEAIRNYCRERGMVVPEGDGALARCIFESLSLKYRMVLDSLQCMAPFAIRRLHVIGGGARNALLNQFTANAVGLPVIAGPGEATAIGNVMVQALSVGVFESVAEMRAFIGRSVHTVRFEPQHAEVWDAGYRKFKKLTTDNK